MNIEINSNLNNVHARAFVSERNHGNVVAHQRLWMHSRFLCRDNNDDDDDE